MNDLLASILERGAHVLVSGLERQEALTVRVRESIVEAVVAVSGSGAGTDLSRCGLGILHECLPAEKVGEVRDRVMPAVRPDLFAFACALGKELLGLDREFFVDDYTILRINYPYAVARNAPHSAENPGIGRVDPGVRDKASSTQKRDPQYDPAAYHKHTPPASWAHGPHQDTWTGHSLHGINLWWAIDDVAEDNSMILYPSTFGRRYEADPSSLYLRPGYLLPRPTKMAMRAGEILVFNPEVLHATHLNVSGRTRVALSARINPQAPRFDPGCFYAREFWHSSADIDQGRMDVIRQFKRDENLEASPIGPCRPPEARTEHRRLQAAPGEEGWHTVEPHDQDRVDRLLVELADGRRVALFRDGGRWRAIGADCPHLETSLLDGHRDFDRIFCPAHGVAFDLESGRSRSPLLRVGTYDVEAAGSVLRIRPRTT